MTRTVHSNILYFSMKRQLVLPLLTTGHKEKVLQCRLLVWWPIKHTVQFASAPQQAASHLAANTAPHGVFFQFPFSFRIILLYCWNLDKKCMTPMNDLLFSFSLSKKYACFNMKWYRTIHNILILRLIFFRLYLINFSCVCVYIYLNPMSLYYMKRQILCVHVSE